MLNYQIQQELGIMAMLMGQSINERLKNDNNKFYIMIFAILCIVALLIVFMVFMFIITNNNIENSRNIINVTQAEKKATSNTIPENTHDEDSFCVKNKHRILNKVIIRNNFLWEYKTYHHDGKLVYITTAERIK